MSNTKEQITILQLYPKDMNIYGDNGNILVLKQRLKWRGVEAVVIPYNIGDTLPESVDIVVGGGGQDSGQEKVHEDLLAIGPTLRQWADGGTPMLVICGLYQLFGHFFETLNGQRIDGIGLLDIQTYATNERLIGNIITHNDTFSMILGYENHSGQTFLGKNAQPLASVIKGAGNNSRDAHEGARYENIIGTYLHGSLLPKNPSIADFLIETACERKGIKLGAPNAIDDSFANLARVVAERRPR